MQRLTQALKQLSDGLDADDASRNRRGTTAQLREATKQLEEVRAAGAPYFAGIGDTMPTDLADLAALAADLLLALEEDPSANVNSKRAMKQCRRHNASSRRS